MTDTHLNVDLLSLPPYELALLLREAGIKRFYFVTHPQTGDVFTSHPLLQDIADMLNEDQRDFEGHEGLFFQVSKHEDIIHGGFVHRTCRGQGQGGTRFWGYAHFLDYLNDGIRLSKGMTHKNALAGLWWGGGKGVISRPKAGDVYDPHKRAEIFKEYGEFISSLRGCYITAEDVETNTTDMANIFTNTRFITCIPNQLGGSGNPSSATALGVVRGMQAGLAHLNGARSGVSSLEMSVELGSLRGKRVLVQGVGHVGEVIIDLVLREGAQVIATDINTARLESLRKKWSDQDVDLLFTERGDLSALSLPCDVLCPAATGAILNTETIPTLQTNLICGAANNQLEDPARDGAALIAQEITYVPDFLVNRMGIVNCANEQYGYVDADPNFMRHLNHEWEASVYQTSLRVLERAQTEQMSPHQAAVQLADELSVHIHPIWGHRGQQIIQSLVDGGWSHCR